MKLGVHNFVKKLLVILILGLGLMFNQSAKAEKWNEWFKKYPYHLPNNKAGETINFIKKIKLDDPVYNKISKKIMNDYLEVSGPKAFAVNQLGMIAYAKGNNEYEAVINALAKCQNLKFKDYIKEEELKKHKKEFGSPRLCVLVNVGDKLLTYKEQTKWSKKVNEVPTIVEKYFEIKKQKNEIAKTPEITPEETMEPDTEPPIIEIAEQITVNDPHYIIEGKVSDKGSDKIYVKVDGQDVPVEKGKFKTNRYSPVDEEITIVAIDQWGNKSTKVVQVKVEIEETEVVRAYPNLNPSKINGYKNSDSIAIIIGIEKYKNIFECIYCNRDASFFREYAIRALGIKSSNIKLLVDNKASREEILKALKIWLPRIAGEGAKEIYIFFSGHALASFSGSDLYLLPQNGNSQLLEDTAISRTELISLTQIVNPKSITMFFDTCYSGKTRNERMLIEKLKPILIVPDEKEMLLDNFTIFSASEFDQVSGSIEEAQQGIFSYYLMKGLEGKADENQDKQITNGELIAYLKTKVSKEAFSQNREQDPTLVGETTQVLMMYQ
jgi:hypothetical protein